ncbi:MAG: DUF1343 domain-containing protein [Candidatus Glassbacteria bacterium]
MFRLATIILLASVAGSCRADTGSTPPRQAVRTGLDVLVDENYSVIAGSRVGVVTNHTGRDSRGRHLIDLFRDSKALKLAAVFTPEHGLAGQAEGEYGTAAAEKDSLPVYSLYGEVKKPRPEWLAGLDVLVFDIQDIGTRFYTYITTLALCMQAASEAGVRFLVLDRPNPVGGLAVEGPVLEKELQGDFIAYYPIPVRHGMTVGELARLFNAEFGIGARLDVVAMKGWQREMYFDDTGLAWVDPSPNMRSLRAAILYPGLGIAEATNLSVGRGTDLPFEIYGAPFIDGRRLAGELRQAAIPGIAFTDTVFTPRGFVYSGETCGGIRARVTDRKAFDSVTAGLHLIGTIRRLYPDRYRIDRIDRWIGRREVKQQLAAGVPPEEIAAGWRKELETFKTLRRKYLLYE